MADEDYGDDDAYFFDDDDYLYVEDDYAIADELAETQVPSPGYTGVYDEIAMESFEYDVYEYFGEIEYGSDSYWDARIKHLEAAKAGEKRKVEAEEVEGEDEARLIKKRRKDAGLEVKDNVMFVPFEARLPPLPPKVPDEDRFALLPDWKERFPDRGHDGSPTGKGKQMPADMKRAAEAEDEEDEENMSVDRGEEMELGSEDELEDDVEYEEEEGATGLDHDLVMQVLRQKLADSGLGDVDESVFKDAIAKMMSGEGDSEDAVGGLASLLLGQKDGGGKAFQGFLAGQGVELGSIEEDEDNDGDDHDHENESRTDEVQDTTPKAKPTRKAAPKASTSSTASPASKSSTFHAKSKSTRSTAAAEPLPKPTSPIVVPSPPPIAIKTSRKRRAPSLDESSLPLPETPTSSAKPLAKRRRAPVRAEPPTNEPEAVPPPATPATGRRTTRSAAATGKDER